MTPRGKARWKQIDKGNAPWQTRKDKEQREDNPGFYAPTYLRYRRWLDRTRKDRLLEKPA